MATIPNRFCHCHCQCRCQCRCRNTIPCSASMCFIFPHQLTLSCCVWVFREIAFPSIRFKSFVVGRRSICRLALARPCHSGRAVSDSRCYCLTTLVPFLSVASSSSLTQNSAMCVCVCVYAMLFPFFSLFILLLIFVVIWRRQLETTFLYKILYVYESIENIARSIYTVFPASAIEREWAHRLRACFHSAHCEQRRQRHRHRHHQQQ